MSKFTQKMMVTMAAAGLVLSPVAAQANTRAGDSTTIYSSSQVQPGLGRAAEGESIGSTSSFLVGLLLGLWTSGIIVIIADLNDDDNGNQSPGAN